MVFTSIPQNFLILLIYVCIKYVSHSVMSDSLRPMDCTPLGSSVHVCILMLYLVTRTVFICSDSLSVDCLKSSRQIIFLTNEIYSHFPVSVSPLFLVLLHWLRSPKPLLPRSSKGQPYLISDNNVSNILPLNMFIFNKFRNFQFDKLFLIKNNVKQDLLQFKITPREDIEIKEKHETNQRCLFYFAIQEAQSHITPLLN